VDSPAKKLRRLLGANGISAAPGAHDCFTARIVERAGHPAVYLGGNAMALGLAKGQPFITLTEAAEIAGRVARTVDVPVIVDAGAGFGEPAHIHFAVREIEAAGAAGLHIDDQPYPKRAAYHRGEGKLVEAAAMAARLRTAVAARRDPDFVIIARTDALRVTKSVDETLARCRLYLDAGADALMILDLGPDQAGVFCNAFPSVPLVWIGGVTPPIPALSELGQAGFRLACYPFNGVAAATVLLGDLWAGLARSGTIEQEDAVLARARKETLELVDMQRFWEIESNGGARGAA
jgi:2-methylisocitrate lyase-like PEP mutase family enzyme